MVTLEQTCYQERELNGQGQGLEPQGQKNQKNQKEFSERHVRNFTIASVTLPMITDRHHRHLTATLASVEDGEMGSREWFKTGRPFTG